MPDNPNNPIPLSDKEFIKLCAFGTPEAVKQALAAGANANARDKYGGTALMAAAENNGDPAVIRALLEAGADVNAKENTDRRTALIFAAGYNSAAVVCALLDAGADANAATEYGETPLLWAVREIGIAAEMGLLAGGVDAPVDQEAARENNLAVVRALIAAGANVNAQVGDAWSVLMIAAWLNHDPEVAETLLDAGAEVNLRDCFGDTALMYAAKGNNLPVMRILLDAGAEMNVRNEENETALSLAQEEGGDEVVLALLAAGADPNVLHEAGDSALM